MPTDLRYVPLDWAWRRQPNWTRLRIDTDRTCKATLWWSRLPSVRKQITRTVRGKVIPCGWGYSFHPVAFYTQFEPGDTTTHTFDPTWWLPGEIGYFTFTYSTDAGMSPSQTVIFKATRPFPLPVERWFEDSWVLGPLSGWVMHAEYGAGYTFSGLTIKGSCLAGPQTSRWLFMIDNYESETYWASLPPDQWQYINPILVRDLAAPGGPPYVYFPLPDPYTNTWRIQFWGNPTTTTLTTRAYGYWSPP